MSDKEQDETERRRFFRIDDEMCLIYSAISEDEYQQAPDELAKLEQSSFALSADFATLNHEHNPVLNNIRHSSPEIAQYFDLINRKLDALSHHLLEDEIPCDEADKYQANISASGIAFDCKDNFQEGQAMKLRMVLLPEKVGILVYGRVTDTKTFAQESALNHVCIDFKHIRYDDQELMIKHNLNKQMQELRQRSEDNDEQ